MPIKLCSKLRLLYEKLQPSICEIADARAADAAGLYSLTLADT